MQSLGSKLWCRPLSRTKVVYLETHWKGHGFKREGKDLMTKRVGEIEWREAVAGQDNSHACSFPASVSQLLPSMASIYTVLARGVPLSPASRCQAWVMTEALVALYV